MFIQKTLKTVCDRYTIGITCFYSVENLWTIWMYTESNNSSFKIFVLKWDNVMPFPTTDMKTALIYRIEIYWYIS